MIEIGLSGFLSFGSIAPTDISHKKEAAVVDQISELCCLSDTPVNVILAELLIVLSS